MKAWPQQIGSWRGKVEDARGNARHRREILLSRSESEFKQMTDRVWEEYELSYDGRRPFRTPDFR